MFDFLFKKHSRTEKIALLAHITEKLSEDFYTRQLYLSSIELLSDQEFEDFYENIVESISPTQSRDSFSTGSTIRLPGMNSI